MSETTRSTDTVSQSISTFERSWRELMIAGAMLAIIGVLAIIFPFVTSVSLSILLGALLVGGALVHVAHAFSASGWSGAVWQVLLAIVYALAGVALLANPVVGLTTLTILLIAYFVVAGIVELFMAFQVRGESRWGWLLVSGVISLVLAGLLWASWPSSAAWAIGLLFGVNLLASGISMIAMAMSRREEASTVAATAEAGGA